jgi:hypothetical protein
MFRRADLMSRTPAPWRFPLPALLTLLAPVGVPGTRLEAQATPAWPAVTSAGAAERHTASGPEIPQPPRSLLAHPTHERERIPAGHSDLPRPDSAPGVEAGLTTAPGDLRFWQNTDVAFATGGGPSPRAPEPSACINQDTAFMTGNWWAGVSKDSGATFSSLSPYTTFPAVDGGFCCDQRCIYSPQHDITIWYLQYGFSGTTARGSVRIAVSVGRAGLRAGQWHSWVWGPQNFNQPARTWLDFPDLAVSSQYLYAASNVFTDTGGNLNSVVWRMSLAELRSGGNLTATFFTRQLPGSPTTLGGRGSYRFAQGLDTDMYFGTHVDQGALKLFRWPDAGGLTWVTRGVPVWQDGVRQSPSPNNTNWMASHDGRIQTGYRNNDEFGFVWSCEEEQPFRPWPFLRVARFRTSDMVMAGVHDVWNGQYGIGYPACTTNVRGDQGVVMAIGGPLHHVRSVVFMVDQFQPTWDGQVWASVNNPTLSTTESRWGDYFTCFRHPEQPNTLVGTGAYMGSASASTSRYVWFSREADEPIWVALQVRSAPMTGVPITVDVIDRNGNLNGLTDFNRTYAAYQGYTLTAPTTHFVGNALYLFTNWTGSYVSNNPVLTVPSIGTVPNLARANYVPSLRLTMRSNVSTSVVVSAVPDDLLGNAGGNAGGAGMDLYYRSGTPVVLVAPATSGGNPFRRWMVSGSPVASRTLNLVMTADVTAIAEYVVHTPGSLTPFGQGCLGSQRLPLVHRARGTPEIGRTVSYELHDAVSLAPCALVLGLSNRSFLGLPLPFDAAPAGAPGCFIYCSQDLVVGGQADATGMAQQGVPYPNDAALVGAHVYTQHLALDLRANRLGLTLSNAIDTLIGGVR